MHPACMHVNTCTYIPHGPTHINIDPTKSIHSKEHKFMVMAETSTLGILHGRNVRGRNVLAEMSVAETSVAEISYILLVSTLVPSFLIRSSSFLQVWRITIISRTSLKFGTIRPGTAELAALEHLKKILLAL